jgi:diguanylate cyclase (GGDEF)-like protein
MLSRSGNSRRRLHWPRWSLVTRLVAFTTPVLVVALASTTALAMPVWTLPERVQDVEVRLKQAVEAHALGTVLTDQTKHFLQYLQLDARDRPRLRTDIERTRALGDRLAAAAPIEVQQLWRELHTSGEAMADLVDDGGDGALELALGSLVPTADTLAERSHRYAEEVQAQAQRSLDQITGIWSLLPAQGGELGQSLTVIAAESHRALAATHAEHSVTHYVATFPTLLAGAGSHPTEKAAAAAVEAQKVLKRLAGNEAQRDAPQARADELLGVLESLRADGREVMSRAAAGDDAGATAHFQNVLNRRYSSEFLPAMSGLGTLHRERLAVATHEARSAARVLQAVLLGGNALFLLLVLGSGVRLLRGVWTPMRDLEVAHRRLADGDTTTRISAAAAGPLGDLAGSFNLLAEELATGSSARLAKTVLDHTEDILLVVDDDVVTWASPAAQRLAGGVAAVVGARVSELLLECREENGREENSGLPSAHLLRADGVLGNYELTWVDLRHDPQVRAHLLLARDVTQRARQQADLAHRAAHDLLTGLPNRTSVTRVLDDLARARRAVTMLFCDLDHFKDVNDSLGHAAGDALLVQVATRLADVTSGLAGAMVARLGGDEFVVLLPDRSSEQGAHIAAAIGSAMRTPFLLEQTGQQVSCSIGLAAAAEGDSWAPTTLLREADLAMYQAKRDGRGRVQQYCVGMQDELIDRLRLDRALAVDVEACVRVHYQPIVDTADGRPVAVEALLRWQDGDRVLPPPVVIARAEATRTIGAVGLQVLRLAAAQVAAWRRDAAPGLSLSVNVSVVELERLDYAADVMAVLDKAGLPPSALTVEITESALDVDKDTLVANLCTLRAAGVALSIDDFGTGWSSLSRLGLICPTEIKIDRTFVALLASGSDQSLVRAVLAVSRELGCRVVAEGVEREEQRAALVSLGTDLMQGYLFERPMDAGAVLPYLMRTSTLSRLPRQRQGEQPAALRAGDRRA